MLVDLCRENMYRRKDGMGSTEFFKSIYHWIYNLGIYKSIKSIKDFPSILLGSTVDVSISGPLGSTVLHGDVSISGLLRSTDMFQVFLGRGMS